MAAGREAALKIMLEMEGNVEQKAREAEKSLGGLAQAWQVTVGVLSSNLVMGAINQIKAGFASIVGVFREGVTGGGEFERYETQLGVLLKSTTLAKDRLAELAVFGQKTPFELPEIVRAEKVLTSFGLTGEDTMKKFGKSAAQIRTMIGDVASGTGVQFEQIAGYVGRFASGSTGEAIQRFQELGVVTRQELTSMGLEFSKAGQLMTPVGEATSVLLQVMQDKFGGMMDKQSATFEGMQSNLADWMGQTKRIIAEPIFDALKDNLGELLTVLNSPAAQEGIKNIAASLGEMAKRVSEVSLLFLKGDIEGGLARITDPATAKALIGIAEAFGKIYEGLQKVEQSNDWISKLTPDEGGRRGLLDVAMEDLMAAEKAGTGRKGLIDLGLGDTSAQAAGIQAVTAAVSNYSMTTSSAALVQKALANEAKYGGEAMTAQAIQAANAANATANAANAMDVYGQRYTAMATQIQAQGNVMATAFSSEAVQSSMAAFNATVADFHAQELAAEQENTLQIEQDAFASQVKQLLAEAQFQQERAMVVAQGEAQIAAAQASGNAVKIAKEQADLDQQLAQYDAKHQAKIAQEQAQYDAEGQIQERALLVQRVQALQAYQAQLQDQQDATLRSLALSVEKAGQEAGLEAATQDALLKMIYGAGSDRLQAEYQMAQDSLAIEKSLAEGKVTSAQAQIEAILAVQQAAIGNAAAAKDAAAAALANFQIKAPVLPPINTAAFTASVPAAASAAGAAGTAASKPMTEKFASVLGDVNQGIDLAEQALIKLLSFSLPEGWKDGVSQLREFATTMVSTLQSVTAHLTLSQMKVSKELGSALSKVVGSFTQFAQLGQLLKGDPISDAEIMMWLDQYKRVMTYIATAVVDLETFFGGYEKTKEIYKSAKRFKTMLDSTLIELSAIKIVQLPDLNVWKNQIMSVITAAFETVTAIRDRIGATNLKRAAADVAVLKNLIELTGSNLSGMKLGVLPDLKTWGDQFVAVIGAAVTAINRANVEIGSLQIKGAADVGPKLKTIIDSVSGGFDALTPATLAAGETFEQRITTYFTQAKFAFGMAVTWLYEIFASAQAMVTQAAEIAGPVSTVFGITADLEKFVPASSGFEERATAYIGQLKFLGGLIVLWLSEIKGDAIGWVTNAAAIGEYVKKLFDLVGPDLSAVVPQGEGFQEKAIAYIAQLRWFGGRLYGWMNEIVQAGVSDAVKLAAEVSDYVAKLFNLVGPDLSKAVPQDADYQTRALAYIAQLKWTGGQLFGWLREIKGGIAEEVKEAGSIGEAVQKLFGLLGIDLTKLVPAGSTFPALLKSFLSNLGLATDQIVPWLRAVRDRYTGEVLTDASATAEAVKNVIGVLSLGDMFAKLTDLSKINVGVLVTRMADKLKQAVDILVPALQSIKDKWGDALGTVAETAKLAAELFGNIANIAKSIDEAASVGGIDIGTVQALFQQLSRLGALTMPTVTLPTTPTTPAADIGGGNTAQTALESAIVKLAAAVDSLNSQGFLITLHGYSDDGSEGDISERITTGQGISIDMRSWSAAKSG
jgi:hypothetical protein